MKSLNNSFNYTHITANDIGETNDIVTVVCVNGKGQTYVTVMNRDTSKDAVTTKGIEGFRIEMETMIATNRAFLPNSDTAIEMTKKHGLTLQNKSSVSRPSAYTTM